MRNPLQSRPTLAAAVLMAVAVLAPILPARAQPDLVTFNLPVTSPVVASSSFYVTNIVANIGDAPCQAYSYVAFLLSTNSGRDYYDDWLDAYGPMSHHLAAGVWRTNIYRIDLPPLLAGTYYLSALADGGVEEEEADEYNNLSSAQPIQVVRGLDLVLTELQSNPIWTNGDNAPIRCVIANLGQAQPWDSGLVRFYLSTDPIITTGDVQVGAADIYFSASGTTVFTDGFTIEVNSPPGIYYFGAIVDDLDRLAESNETNNTIVGHQVELRSDFDWLTLTEVRVTGMNVMVSFTTAPGRSYALEWTASLATPSLWTTVAGAEDLPGTGGTLQVPDPAGLRPGQRFYRARLLP